MNGFRESTAPRDDPVQPAADQLRRREVRTVLINSSSGGGSDYLRMRAAMVCARASVGIEECTKYAGIPSAML